MRQIGQLRDEDQAVAFGDYLYSLDIDNELELHEGFWVVWIKDEERMKEAAAQLEAFRQNPSDRRYAAASRIAQTKREQAERDNEAARKRFFDRNQIFPDRAGLGRVTLVLLGLSLLCTLLTDFGANALFQKWLAFAPFTSDGTFIRFPRPLVALQSLELWRWITPIFVHMNFLHALFNLMMLASFGGHVEARIGRGWFVALVLLLAALPNLAQFLTSGPAFGGMSGVLYGLLGFCWLRGRLDPNSGLAINPTTIAMLMAWYFACLVGFIPNVANTVHTVGLGLGMLTGLGGSLWRTR